MDVMCGSTKAGATLGNNPPGRGDAVVECHKHLGMRLAIETRRLLGATSRLVHHDVQLYGASIFQWIGSVTLGGSEWVDDEMLSWGGTLLYIAARETQLTSIRGFVFA